MEEKERSFESLQFYQDSLKLLKASYKLAGNLPNYERYNLSDQLRRAACSISLNIAEGYGRYHYLERLRFLYIARGSKRGNFKCLHHCPDSWLLHRCTT